MCSGRGTTIAWDDREWGGSGLHAVGIKVRLKNCNGKGNTKSNESVRIGKMSVYSTDICFCCLSFVFSSISFLLMKFILHKREEQKARSLEGGSGG